MIKTQILLKMIHPHQIRTQFQTPELPRKEKFLVMMKHKLKDLEHKRKVQNIVRNATLQ